MRRLTQQVDGLQRDLGLPGRDRDPGLLERFQDADPQISGHVAAHAQIDKGVEFERETVDPEIFKIEGRCGQRQDTGMVLRDLEQNRFDPPRIGAIARPVTGIAMRRLLSRKVQFFTFSVMK